MKLTKIEASAVTEAEKAMRVRNQSTFRGDCLQFKHYKVLPQLFVKGVVAVVGVSPEGTVIYQLIG